MGVVFSGLRSAPDFLCDLALQSGLVLLHLGNIGIYHAWCFWSVNQLQTVSCEQLNLNEEALSIDIS